MHCSMGGRKLLGLCQKTQFCSQFKSRVSKKDINNLHMFKSVSSHVSGIHGVVMLISEFEPETAIQQVMDRFINESQSNKKSTF
mmetsp:Transcript_57548/g.89564  ORF Transcript_57548/g.89564 Transcript_57548/m.89564 type:complete len:84 (+) Transcript_57548:173-424(+)